MSDQDSKTERPGVGVQGHGYVAWHGGWRQWTYEDGERPRAECYDCERPYETMGDCVIDNVLWERINPTRHRGAGLLCANCITERLRHLGISGVDAKLWTAT
jgi:hypothetical protein